MAAVVVTKFTVDRAYSQQFVDLLQELKAKAVRYPGYLSGQTITSAGRNGVRDVVLISRWRSRGNWQAWEGDWKQDGERSDLEARMAAMLAAPILSTVYTDSPLAVPADV